MELKKVPNLLLFISVSFYHSSIVNCYGTKGDNVSYLLNSFQEGYDRRLRPNYGGSPVNVGVTLYILSIGDLSEKFMDFTFDMYFRQFWSDNRLQFNGSNFGIDKLVVGAEYIRLIWVPDTFFVNEKVATFHKATTENQFLRISQNGDVLRSIRLTIKATCNMNLANFPMDDQLCTVEVESFGYTMADLRYEWHDGLRSVQMSPDVSLPQFVVIGHRQRQIEVSLSSGNYSRLLADVQFTRSMGYYMIQVYIPSSLIVVMSWVSFWLNRGAAPARVSLGVTTVLTMTTLSNSVNAALPKVSYMKSIDIYLFVCFFMVFGALIEYACVGYTDKRIQLHRNRFIAMQRLLEQHRSQSQNSVKIHPQQHQHHQQHNNCYQRDDLIDYSDDTRSYPYNSQFSHQFPMMATMNISHHHHQHNHSQVHSNILYPPNTVFGMRGSDIDKYSRIVFPVIFVAFHITYWTLCLSISGQTPADIVLLE